MIRAVALVLVGVLVATAAFAYLPSGEADTDTFEEPSLAWHTYPDMDGYCTVKLDGQNSTLGDADAVIVDDGSMEYRWDGGRKSWSFTVEGPDPDGLEYGGQIWAWAARGDWRKHLYVGRVTGDCELVEDPYGEAPDS